MPNHTRLRAISSDVLRVPGGVKEARRQVTRQWLRDQGYEVGAGFADGFGATLFPVRRGPR